MIIWRFGRAVALADGIDSFEMLGVSVFLRGTVLGRWHMQGKKTWNENLRLVKRSCILHVFIMYLLF